MLTVISEGLSRKVRLVERGDLLLVEKYISTDGIGNGGIWSPVAKTPSKPFNYDLWMKMHRLLGQHNKAEVGRTG